MTTVIHCASPPAAQCLIQDGGSWPSQHEPEGERELTGIGDLAAEEVINQYMDVRSMLLLVQVNHRYLLRVCALMLVSCIYTETLPSFHPLFSLLL